MSKDNWKLKDGNFKKDYITENEIWGLFNHFFSSKTSKNTAYKFIFMKSLVRIASELEVNQAIKYYDVFEVFTETYWNLYIGRHLVQSRKSQKSSAEKIIDRYYIEYQDCDRFSKLSVVIRDKLIKDIELECKKNVIGAVYGDFDGYIYSFSNDDSKIDLNQIFFDFIKQHKSIILKLNYLEWVKYMENVNDTVNINELYYLAN